MSLYQEWIENLQNFETLPELQKSGFFAVNGKSIVSFLGSPQIHRRPDASPRLNAFLRAVQWNIEKGKRFDIILDRIMDDEILKWADVIILNEADYGMNRSRNRHVALELADRLDMHMVFGPAHFELTKGTDDDLLLEGRNAESLQGNAILSRYPILEASQVSLPVTFEPYEFSEKRFGCRSCLWARIEAGRSPLWIGSVHLELRNTPRCRASQVRHIMDNLPGGEDASHLLGGDLNTNSFSRGTALRTLRSLARLLSRSPERIHKQLLYPEDGREPLFRVARENGFLREDFNSNEETARTGINTLEEANRLPRFLLRRIQRRLEPYNGYLRFKLDWFLARRLDPLRDGQISDSRTAVSSRDPGRIETLNYGIDRASDHRPIYVDIAL